ncbi:phosphoribosylformylglycinamidine synthase subunit PurQ [Candidatus Kaiserbacteria bacterium]|nr:phosphoribosylformylglycinamidine synthase subunit PurQ [Candidatus Kaiserbacteria bacterium]
MKSKSGLRVGIVRFPGSNCDHDTLNYFTAFGHRPLFLWFKDTRIPAVDLIVLPGGFAFGDRVYAKATASYTIDPGKLALTSPIMKPLRALAEKGMPILGICNGFQILVKAGMLPGVLLQNDSKKFFCDYVDCTVTGNSFFSNNKLLGKTFSIPVAHGYGKYSVSKKEAAALRRNGQVFLEYKSINPNGSTDDIAGVCNKEQTIFGMMPHPERSPRREYFMHAIESYVRK